ncbi:redoxin family protein [Crateriforma spongiae]|uniref:redoxin family protein n=1 Tax=Crateriforma spongiae TaxID=2724528 RepID=UPI001448A28B|nr:redoxin family protein [Crateriforma spongiae]
MKSWIVTGCVIVSLWTGIPAGAATPTEVRQGPQPIKPGDVGVGRRVADLAFTDIDGHTYQLSDWFGGPESSANESCDAVVFAMTGIGCPLCKKYAPTLAKIQRRYAGRGVRFVFVNPNQSEKIARLRDAMETHGMGDVYVRDDDEHIAHALDAHTTTEVFVIDAARTLVYRGAVDDQYGFGYSLDEPRKHFLTDALDAVLDDRRPSVSATTSPGCDLYFQTDPPADASAGTLTYHNRISRIIADNCAQCHRDGGSAPFALDTYSSVIDYAGMIASVVRRGVMPPWFAADPKQETNHVPVTFANDRSLAEDDRRDLLAWIESGAAEGDIADAPLRHADVPSTQWHIGKPDLEVQIPKQIQVKATGQMPYKHTLVRLNLKEGRWVQAVEIRPTDPSVVHHVLVFLKDSRDRNVDIDEESGFLAAYVPGNTFQRYPEGMAKRLPAGSDLVFQLHYTPNGTETSDQTRLGIRFADQPPRRVVKNVGIANHRIKIPPGADNHEETASLVVPADVHLLAVMPHMHLRGKAFRYDLTTPGGSPHRLLDVPNYDFNWQLEYRFNQPLAVTAGSRIDLTAWYDNSENNPANPDPGMTVRWGPQTDDEMMLGYVEYFESDEIVGDSAADDPIDVNSKRLIAAFRKVDGDNSGTITRQEFPRPLLFGRIDADGDDLLTSDEVLDAAEIILPLLGR